MRTALDGTNRVTMSQATLLRCATPLRTRRLPRRLVSVALLAAISAFVGCVKDTPPAAPPPIYTGPIDTLDVLLARINQNNGRLNTLVGVGTFDATLGQDQKTLLGQITILHTKPDKVFLKLSKEAIDILKAGTNGEAYWLSVFGETDTTYFGKPRGPGRENTRLPLAPELIADVLGIATMNLDLLAQPVPTLRFNPDYDAYMLSWHTPITDRWVTVREIWYDRQTLQPRLIWLFDRNGRVVLRGKLSNFGPVQDLGNDAPQVAQTFDLFFPESNSRLKFGLDLVRARRGGAPNPNTYRFDPATAGTAKVENLDEDASQR
jgi:hypothetical protein